MSKKPSSKLHPFIKQTLILMSGITLLSSSFVIAQENIESSSESSVVPVAPAPELPEPVAPAPVAPTPELPEPVAPAPKANHSPPPQLSAPRVSVPSQPPVNAAELLPAPQPIAPQPEPKITPENNSAYIDPTPYNAQPTPSVIFETRNGVNNPSQNPVKPVNKPQSLNNSSHNLRVERSYNHQQNLVYTRKNQNNQLNNQRGNNQNFQSNYSYQPTIISQNNQKAITEPTVYNRATRVIKRYIPTNTSLLYPLSIPAPITSAFGWRVHPISGAGRLHAGTDIGAPSGTPVLAAYQGRVENAGSLGGYGLAVTILHEDSSQESLYGHLSQIFVQSGQWVEQGTVIGLVGSTGYSTGPHLHFEWRHRTASGWVAVDAGDHLKLAMEALIESMQVASIDNSTNNN